MYDNNIVVNQQEMWSPLADDEESFDVTQYTRRFTMEILLKCVYSSNTNCLDLDE